MNFMSPNEIGKNFYVVGGTLRHDAPSYIERQADRELFEGLSQGELCYVLTARQMGKSSLMIRTAQRLRTNGIVVAVLDLTAIGQNLTIEQWYCGSRRRSSGVLASPFAARCDATLAPNFTLGRAATKYFSISNFH
jgi:hypothetical protein